MLIVDCFVLPSETERPDVRCEHSDGVIHDVFWGTLCPDLSFMPVLSWPVFKGPQSRCGFVVFMPVVFISVPVFERAISERTTYIYTSGEHGRCKQACAATARVVVFCFVCFP